jgi:hypothetical protein
MTRVRFAAVVTLLALAPACSGQAPPAPAAVPPARARDEARELLYDLREAKTLAGLVADRGVREKLERALARAERRAEALQRFTAPGGPAGPAAMTDGEFARLLQAVRAEPFDNRRLPLIKDAARHAHFTCAQATELVKVMSFGDGRTGAAVALHPRLVDPANFYQVLGAMQFDAEKDKVRRALGLSK